MRLQTWKRLIARSGTGALATLLAWGASSLLWAGEPGARAVFWRLPTTIFENTVPGLSENEKYELLVQGATEHWAIRHSSHDVLEIAEAPDGDSTVLLRLFRGNGYVLAAIGTDSEPAASPPEPNILDFFAPGTRIPPDVTASLPFCVRPEGLEVRPLFWTSIGLAHVPGDNAVFYVWTGTRFSKRIVELRPPKEPEAQAAKDETRVVEQRSGE